MPPRPGSATRAKKAIMLVNMRVDPASRSRASAAYARYARRDAGAASTHRSTTYVSGLSARRSRKPQRKADESGRGPAVHRAAASGSATDARSSGGASAATASVGRPRRTASSCAAPSTQPKAALHVSSTTARRRTAGRRSAASARP